MIWCDISYFSNWNSQYFGWLNWCWRWMLVSNCEAIYVGDRNHHTQRDFANILSCHQHKDFANILNFHFHHLQWLQLYKSPAIFRFSQFLGSEIFLIFKKITIWNVKVFWTLTARLEKKFWVWWTRWTLIFRQVSSFDSKRLIQAWVFGPEGLNRKVFWKIDIRQSLEVNYENAE